METIGKRICRLRKENRLSLSMLAEKVGMSSQALWNLENDVVGKTFEKLPLLAKALECRIDDLFPEMDDVKTDSAGGFENESLDDFEM
ncbi:MAG: helix-turn-helix transcriptional regulator [Clostridia bacterium]|nr:helix-turn-helix transcriptional regulator [Clostridia bacterium]